MNKYDIHLSYEDIPRFVDVIDPLGETRVVLSRFQFNVYRNIAWGGLFGVKTNVVFFLWNCFLAFCFCRNVFLLEHFYKRSCFGGILLFDIGMGRVVLIFNPTRSGSEVGRVDEMARADKTSEPE